MLRLAGPARFVEPRWPQAHPLEVTLHAEGFEAGVRQVRERIAAGDVYQVNLTTRATVAGHQTSGPDGGAHLLAALCRRGLPRFAAWVRLPDGPEFVSASPELLVEQAGRAVRAEPMKGTAPAGQRAWLEASQKDAAELAMITDLLRDDLHHVCARGTVAVPHPRRYLELPYAVQAVSDVTGTLREGVDTAGVLAQLHPGGSITGAPRPAAQALIASLEATPRGAYCGTLGWTDEVGTSRFALLIRTASREGTGPWTYGVGGGVTWDSSPEGELAEVHVKLGALR